ncbi:MAG: insulinase family protein [Blastocatellia bacterium]|nr:insulinase family protein [Blastocatellia bacterium]MDW8168302.1 pitrilysin family protein [Acidobacteriota bacterium]
MRIRITVSFCAMLVLSLSWVRAQGPGGSQMPGPTGQSLKGAVIKGKAPVNREILRVRLPRPQEARLKNGLEVILLEDHRLPMFTMQMVIRSGGLADPPDHRGLAQFTAALLREGTKRRTSREIAEQLDTLGITFSATSGLSSLTSTVSISGLIENLEEALDLFADIIRHPTFPPEEVERYKTRTLAQLQLQRSLPQFLAQERFNRVLYGEHPAGWTVPPVESVRRLTSDALARFHATHYRPNNAFLAVVGDMTLRDLLPKIERFFGDWEPAEIPRVEIPSVAVQSSRKIHLIHRPQSPQTVIQLGVLGITRTDPDYFAVLLANHILGGGPTGRLFLNLREDKGYTYGAYSSFTSSKFRGVWGASAAVRTEVTEGAMREFLYELQRLRDERVSDEELENAKRALVGSFALSLERPQELLQNIITQKIYNLPADYWDTYPQKVFAITARDVQRVAQKYLDLTQLQIVAVGDAPRIREVLTKFGPIEVLDAEGRPLSALQ